MSEAFIASWSGRAEVDGFNQLVLAAGLTWREVAVLRSYSHYLRQIGTPYTERYVEQVLAGARSLARGEVPGGPTRVSNVVFMGMGEPMANYKAVIGAVRRLTDPQPDGLGMSARGITVSTVGLVPRIMQLAEEGIPVTLRNWRWHKPGVGHA